MRVILQDGTIDIPYELSAVTIGHKVDLSKFNINIRSKLLDERPCIVATYSTEEKAQKAMEMLRKKYCKYTKAICQSYCTLFDNPKVFRFPADEDVEV